MSNSNLPIIFALAFLLFGGAGIVMSQKRGIRNNNPANIRHGENWVGMRADQTDKDFVQFISPEYGIRALYKNLLTYRNKYGLNTIEGIINRWAPPLGKDPKTGKTYNNNTEAYIRYVSSVVGTTPKSALSLSQYPNLIKAIIKFENGEQPYTDQQINAGISLA